MVEIYSQYIHDHGLRHVVLPKGDEVEGWGFRRGKIPKTLDHAEVKEAGHGEAIDIYRSVARRLTDYRDMAPCAARGDFEYQDRNKRRHNRA